MSDLHKIRLPYPASSSADLHMGQPIGANARILNSHNALVKLGEIHEWLEANERKDHYVNIYDNTDDETGRGELILVLSNRDTAIMAKLALS